MVDHIAILQNGKKKKKKNQAINPKNTHDKCFQCAVTVALTYQNIKNKPEWIQKIKSFINRYNWKKKKKKIFHHVKITGKNLK